MNISAALSDPTRVRALMSLRQGELCLCQVTELLGLASSTVSKHLSVLKQAGLVEARKQGRWMYYRLAEKTTPAARAGLRWVLGALADDAQIAADEAALKRIRCEDLEAICKRQGERRACCSSAPATPAAARWPKGSREASKAT